jgi:hypothetical protein
MINTDLNSEAELLNLNICPRFELFIHLGLLRSVVDLARGRPCRGVCGLAWTFDYDTPIVFVGHDAPTALLRAQASCRYLIDEMRHGNREDRHEDYLFSVGHDSTQPGCFSLHSTQGVIEDS